MESVHDRFMQIIKENRYSQADYAEAMNIAQSSTSRIFNEISESSKIIYFIALQKLSNCNLNWIATGEGPKYLEKVPTEQGISMAAEAIAEYGQENNVIKLLMNRQTQIEHDNINIKKILNELLNKIDDL